MSLALRRAARAVAAALALASAALVTGCWDRLEIEDRAAVLAVGLDPGARPGYVRLTAQIGIPGRVPLGPAAGGGGGGGGATTGTRQTVFVTSAEGATVADAFEGLQAQLNDQIWLGQLHVLAVGEALARRGLAPYMDYFRRSPEVRRTVWLIVTRDAAASAMELAPSFARVPALFLSEMMDHAVAMGRLPVVTLGAFWNTAAMDGQTPIVPYVRAEGEHASLLGLAVLPGQCMRAVVPMDEVPALLDVIGGSRSAEVVTIPAPGRPGERLDLRAVDHSARLVPSVAGGRPHMEIFVRMEVNLVQKVGTHLFDRPDQLLAADRAAEAAVEGEIGSLIRKTQSWQADIFGFGEEFRGKEPAYWHELAQAAGGAQAGWRDAYPSLSFTVRADVHIRRTGTEDR
ncbi:MAG: Ger(x)C family spore germination protein [Clostridia bacterium]|nr:Ger(x)C family spore germination protein [Clostridia bacterium]